MMIELRVSRSQLRPSQKIKQKGMHGLTRGVVADISPQTEHDAPVCRSGRYQKFLELKIALKDFNAQRLSPSSAIDQVWHLHILDTEHYESDIRALQKNLPGEV